MNTSLRYVKGRLGHLVLLIVLALVAGTSAGTSAVARNASPTTSLHAIVYGSNLQAANAALGSAISLRQPLGEIGGESVSLVAKNLDLLTAQDGVVVVVSAGNKGPGRPRSRPPTTRS